MSELLELAARVEAATGADRELDGSIWWATLSADAVEHLDRTGFVRECIERDGSAGKALAQFYDSSNPSCLAKIAFQRAYTASLDAAMTLVPEGCDRWVVCFVDDPVTGKEFIAGVGANKTHNVGATPALALCAAALRAHASQGKEA